MVLFDQATYDKLLSEAPKFKLITPSILSDRLRVKLYYISESWKLLSDRICIGDTLVIRCASTS